MRTSRRRVLGLAAAALIAVPKPARAQTLAPIRVGASFDEGLTPVLYGMQAGIFKDVGLDVQLQKAASGGALASAVAGGSVDVAKSSLMSLITAHTRGVPFKIVAGAALHVVNVPTNDILVLKNSPIRTGRDANGKTAAVLVLGSLDVLGVRGWVDEHGGDSSTMKFIELPFSAMISALEQGRADMATVANPAMTEDLESGRVRALAATYDAVSKHFLLAAWFATEQWAQANPALVQRFAEGVRRSAAYTNAHPADTIPILVAYSHVDAGIFSRMVRDINATLAVTPGQLQPAIDAAYKYQVIKERFPARELLLSD